MPVRQVLRSRSEWLAAKQTTLGASESAAILGVSPWKGALQLYHEKRGTVPTPQGETFARELGLALERPIAELYAGRTQRKIWLPQPGTFELYTHPKRPHMVATLDGLTEFAGGDGVPDPLEIKTAAITKAAAWTNEPPIDYQVQVQHQLAVTGRPRAVCVALIGGVSLVWADITRDEEFIAMLEAACDEFERRVTLGDPPPADGTEATKAFLARLYRVTPTSATLGPEALDLDAARERAIVDEKAAHGRRLLAENSLKVLMGENAQGILSNGVVYTRKTVKRTGYTVQPTEFVDFRRKGIKGEKAPAIKRGAAPSIEDVARAFEADQRAEAAADDFDITFD